MGFPGNRSSVPKILSPPKDHLLVIKMGRFKLNETLRNVGEAHLLINLLPAPNKMCRCSWVSQGS
jgi:hypothetical protein